MYREFKNYLILNFQRTRAASSSDLKHPGARLQWDPRRCPRAAEAVQQLPAQQQQRQSQGGQRQESPC